MLSEAKVIKKDDEDLYQEVPGNPVSHSSFSKNSKKSLMSFDGISDSSIDIQSLKPEDQSQKGKKNNRAKGIFFVMMFACSFTCMVVSCKLAYQMNSHLTGFDYLIVRATSMLILSAIQVYALKINVFKVEPRFRTHLIMRCLSGASGMLSFFVGLKYIPASKATLITNIHPILVTIMAYFVLNESITVLKILAVVGAFIGVFIFTSHKNDTDDGEGSYSLGITLVTITCF